MITVKDGVFRLDTDNTTYVFRVMPYGYLQHLYYGAKLSEVDDYGVMIDKQGTGQGTSIGLDEKENRFFPDNTCFEISSVGRGDFREAALLIADKNGSELLDLKYIGYDLPDEFAIPDLPNSRGKDKTLAVKLSDEAKGVDVTLYYSTHINSDVIVKSLAVTNVGKEEISLLRVMSNQLDLARDDFILDTLDGAWGRERQINSEALRCGVTKIDSKRGVSSNCHNP